MPTTRKWSAQRTPQPYPIIQVPADAGEQVEQQGTKRKFWYAESTQLFKEGRPGTGENWAEKVACEICALLAIPHAHYEFAIWQGREGVVTESFLPADYDYVPANVVLSRLMPEYRGWKRFQARQHTVRIFLTLGADASIKLPVGYDVSKAIRRADDLMVGYLLLDALIGNSDRHGENWGFVVRVGSPPRILLAPTFDHASSLGRNETDARRRGRLTTRDRGYSVEAYAERTRSGFFATPAARRTMTTLEAFEAAARMRPKAARCWVEALSDLGEPDFASIFDQVPTHLITTPARDFALRMLAFNRERLLKTELRG